MGSGRGQRLSKWPTRVWAEPEGQIQKDKSPVSKTPDSRGIKKVGGSGKSHNIIDISHMTRVQCHKNQEMPAPVEKHNEQKVTVILE